MKTGAILFDSVATRPMALIFSWTVGHHRSLRWLNRVGAHAKDSE